LMKLFLFFRKWSEQHGLRHGWTFVCACFLFLISSSWILSQSPYEGSSKPSLESSTPSTLVFGMSAALSGTQRELGIQMRQGVLAAFERSNRQGGVRGHHLRLVSLDDSLEPQMTITNIRRLLEEEKPIAIIGNTGTSTSVVAIPMIERFGIPFIAPLTGAASIRSDKSPSRYVIHYRPSYLDEIKIIFKELVEKGNLAPCDVAFFAESSVMGGDDLVLVDEYIESLHDHGGVVIGFSAAGGGVSSVENALADILVQRMNPRLIIMAGTYPVCARFIRLAHQNKINPLFICLSSVGTIPLIHELNGEEQGVVVTQVVPNIYSQTSLVQEYQKDLDEFLPGVEPTFLSLEGYLAARITLKALEGVESPITSEGLIGSLELMGDFDLGTSTTLCLTPEDHQASDEVWVTVLKDKKAQSLSWEMLRSQFKLEQGED
jgi:ABC-type branched-subunit amino acid transport system substrate-binding protein